VSFESDIRPLLKAKPAFEKFVLGTLKIDDAGSGVRISDQAMPHLGGARMGPYEFRAVWHSTNGDVPVTLIVDTDVKFLDKAGREIANGSLKQAVRLTETFSDRDCACALSGSPTDPQHGERAAAERAARPVRAQFRAVCIRRLPNDRRHQVSDLALKQARITNACEIALRAFQRCVGVHDAVEVVGVVAGLDDEVVQFDLRGRGTGAGLRGRGCRFSHERPFRTSVLQQPPHPLPNGGGSSNGLEDREALTRTGKACAFPFEPPKTGGANRKAADHVR
jgi:hypothetical protein